MRKMIFKSTVESGCSGSVLVDSTGLCGGDAGHGGRTIVRIELDGDGFEIVPECCAIVVKAEGDWELMTLAAAFREASELLQIAIEHSPKYCEAA